VNTKKKLQQKGQTTIEYLLLLVAIFSLGSMVFGRIREYFIGENQSCIAGSKAFVCRLLVALPSPTANGLHYYKIPFQK